MPISFYRPRRLLSRHSIQPHRAPNEAGIDDNNADAANNILHDQTPNHSSYAPQSRINPRPSPARRSRRRCLPCVGLPTEDPVIPAAPRQLSRPGFEHVDAAGLPPIVQPASSRCACEIDHHRAPMIPDEANLPSTPRQTPLLQPTANRPPTPSAHAFAGLLPSVADTPTHQLPHTPRPSPSNRPLHVHAANLVSQLPETIAAASPSRTADQPPAHRRGAPVNRRRRDDFVRRSQSTAFAAAGSRSVQLHDFNSNMMVLVTLGEGIEVSDSTGASMRDGPRMGSESNRSSNSSGSRTGTSGDIGSGNGSASGGSGGGGDSGGTSPAHSESEHEGSSQDGSAGEVGVPEVVASEDGSEEADDSENLSHVTSDNSRESLEKRLAEGTPTEIINRALSAIIASEESRHRELSDDAYGVVMRALERVLTQSAIKSDCLSDVHPDDRAEVHYRLAKYHATKCGQWPDTHCDSVLRNCRDGLFLLHGRERLFPKTAAELHALACHVLLLPRAPKQVQEFLPAVFRHLRDARIAMYGYKKTDQELAFRLSLLTAAAHLLNADEPVCDNLLSAYTAYREAEHMLRMGDLKSGPEWIKVGCHQLQVMLRFLSHKRKSTAEDGSSCPQTAACKREATAYDDISDLTAENTVTRAKGFRLKIMRYFDVNKDVLESEAERRQVICTAHEAVAHAYLERAAVSREKRLHDLNKAAMSIDKAIGACAWDDDFTGNKYSALRELAEDVNRKVRAFRSDNAEFSMENSAESSKGSSESENEAGT